MLLAGIMIAQAVEVTYTPDNTTVFRNPERGFTEEISAIVTESNPYVIKGEIDDTWGDTYSMTMPVVLYNFNKFKSKDLPDKVLKGFDEDMQELRSNGLKCVLRFAYTETEDDKVDATPEWVKRHLEQLNPYLAKNADVIYVLEAGFVGVWGEWYYTANYTDESQQMNTNRRKVIDALLANVPADRFILCRYPLIKIGYLGDEIPLTTEEAFTGTARARMGHHNDAFLNTYGNEGTYGRDGDGPDDDPVLRQYIASETLYVPNGGETNVEKSSLAQKVYADAPAEMSTYHWSFCGSSYAKKVTDKWRSSGIFDTLNIHMGYRYNLIKAQFSDQAVPDGKMNITIRLSNDGYAPIYNERKAYLVLKKESTICSIPLQTDPRRWLPNGVVTTINEQVQLPNDIPEGTYNLYLWLPDNYPSIASDPRYAVRFANKEIWDSQTGYNDLKAQVTISSGVPSEAVDGVCEPISMPKKIIENGIFYILMPNGKKVYCF